MTTSPDTSKPQGTNHRACEDLTGLLYSHLPSDGRLGTLRRLARDSTVWSPDDATDRMFFVKRGEVVVRSDRRSRYGVTIRTVNEGEPLGELCRCIERDHRRHTTATTTRKTELLEVAYDEFLAFLSTDERALDAFAITLCSRLGEAERRIEILAYRGASDRLGRLLLQLAETRTERRGTGAASVVLHASHNDLARMAAMNRSHVTVTMGKFRALGLVAYGASGPLRVYPALLTRFLETSSSDERLPKKL